MASAVTIVARQGGFAVGIAALGAVLGDANRIETYVPVFGLAALGAVVGALAAARLLPRSQVRSTL